MAKSKKLDRLSWEDAKEKLEKTLADYYKLMAKRLGTTPEFIAVCLAPAVPGMRIEYCGLVEHGQADWRKPSGGRNGTGRRRGR